MLHSNCVQWSAFGLGHVLNDLVACGWFSFYLVYLTHVLLIPDVEAGLLLFIGQVADALATPVVGILSDRCTRGSPRGRKICLGVGTAFVGLSNPLLYAPCPFGEKSSQFWFLATIIIIFQFAWAATQISHLAMLTDIGHSSHVRTLLNSIRFGATVCSNLVVFIAAYVVFSSGSDRITPLDAPRFRTLAYIVTLFGLLCSAVCLFFVQIPERGSNSSSRQLGEGKRIQWWQWFLRADFWQAGMLYMCSRLVTNTVQVYIQLYVVDALHMKPWALAVVPSALFAGQMAASVTVPALTRQVCAEVAFVIGLLLIGIASLFAYLAYTWGAELIYVGSGIMGVGCGIVMVVSLAIVAELVSTQKQTSAWVYGLMSFSDKLSGGIALLLVQKGLESFGSFGAASPARALYLVDIMTMLPVAIAVAAFLTIGSMLTTAPSEEEVVQAGTETQRLLSRKGSSRPGSPYHINPSIVELLACEARFGWGHWQDGDEDWFGWEEDLPCISIP